MNQRQVSLNQAIDIFAAEQNDANREVFYQTLLSSDLIVPLSQEQEVNEEGNLSIQMTTDEENHLLFPFFSSIERLEQWIDQEAPYCSVPARQYLELALKEKHRMLLDPAGPNTYEFTVQEIRFLLDDFEDFMRRRVINQQLMSLNYEECLIESNLKASLEKSFKKYPEISEAYYVSASPQDKIESKQNFLALYFKDEQENLDIVQKLQSDLSDMNIISLANSQLFEKISGATEAFYFNY